MHRGGGERAGYSLMELFVVMAIIGVMAGVSLGAYVRYSRGSELAEGASLVRTVLAAARQAAITRGVERRVAIDLRNDKLWIERKIDEGRGRAWKDNAIRAGEIISMPRFVDLADINCSLGLLHSDATSFFPVNVPSAIVYVVFSPQGAVTEISAGNRVETSQTSFTLHLALTNDPVQLESGRSPYNYALITSGQLRSIRGRIGPNATDADARAMLARSKVHSITVLGNTGRITVYPYGKNNPWHDDKPTGVYR